jgi:hypothetical protein
MDVGEHELKFWKYAAAHVEVDANLLNPGPVQSPSTSMSQFPNAPKRKKHLLSSADALFAELRDKNFAIIGSILNRVAKRINADYEGRHQAKTPSQLRDFVGKMSSLQADHQSLRLRTFVFAIYLCSKY